MDIEHIKNKIQESYSNATTIEGIGRISFSQYSKFATCPRSWELSYARDLRQYTPSIFTSFGTAFHETVQEFLSLYLEGSKEEALAINLPELLKNYMVKGYTSDLELTDGEHFSTEEELLEFWEDGCKILNEFLYHRDVYFDPNRYELLGIEAPLFMKALNDEDFNVYMLSFLDIVLYDKVMDRVLIVDIKTSSFGWNHHMKKNELKQSQLVLYKHFFSKQYDIPEENIEIQFLIVTRKIREGNDYIESFVPSTGSDFLSEVVENMSTFVKTCFNADGSYNIDREYRAIKGSRSKHCKYCEFKDREDLCPKKERSET